MSAHTNSKKTYPFQSFQFSETIIIQTIQFSLSSVTISKTVPFQTIQLSIGSQFNFHRHFYDKLLSLVKQFYFKQFSLQINQIFSLNNSYDGYAIKDYIQKSAA